MTSRCDLLFETDRFNLSEPGPHFINECCFGEDFLAWLQPKLTARNIISKAPIQEDWGWCFYADHLAARYFVGLGGTPDADGSNQGQWRLMIQKCRSILQRLTGQNKMTPDDPLVMTLKSILEAEPGFAAIHFEPP